MRQPELGRKILELRKAKGLTQEELVSQCNLNIRTLQRIESGEVLPRANTMKLILTVLDYEFINSLEESPKQTSVSYWFEQFYINVFDLFNLKTNAMKKITILSIIFSLIVLGLFIISGKSNAQKENENIVSSTSEFPKEGADDGAKFTFFYCKGCFDDGEEIIGRDIRFKLNGVYVSTGLIKLNQKSGEFKVGYMKGHLSPNKVEVYIYEEIFNEGIDNKYFEFKGTTVKQEASKVLLKGSSVFTINYENIRDTIMSEEISITAL
jgi:transcriptional regulator with XRE-family HTH domain